MYCSKCGKELTPGTKFCVSCGTPAPKENYASTVTEQPASIVTAPAKSGKKSIVIAAILTLVVLLAASGTIFYVIQSRNARELEARQEEEREEKRKEKEERDKEREENGDSETASNLLGELFGKTEETAAETADETEATGENLDYETEVAEETSEYEEECFDEYEISDIVRVNATDGYANFRSTPEKADNIYTEIYTGTLLGMYDRSGDWIEVYYGGIYGWVHSSQVAQAERYANGDLYGALCPWSSTELIRSLDTLEILEYNAENIFGLNYPKTRTFSQMVVNEIYARNGYIFSTPEIQQYFESQPWYNPVSSDMDAVYKNMNQIEKDNIKFLK